MSELREPVTGAAVPSSTDPQRVVSGHGFCHSATAHSVPSREGRARGKPGPWVAARKAGGRAAADTIKPLAGEAGEKGWAVQESRAAVSCWDARPQVRLAVIPALVDDRIHIYIDNEIYSAGKTIIQRSRRCTCSLASSV